VTTVGDVVRGALAELGPEASALARVRLCLRPEPSDEDLARGCDPEQLGAFWGIPRELGRPGQLALPDYADPEGEIVIFWANLRPLNAATMRHVLHHELMHALGYDEDEVEAMGLGACALEAERCCS